MDSVAENRAGMEGRSMTASDPASGTPPDGPDRAMPRPAEDLVSLSADGHATGDPVRVPPRCLSFTVAGDWAHFRRGEGNVVKRTYRIPPRTTIAGLVAAILGMPRDQYYELFAKGRSAIAIEPLEDLRTINLPENTLDTMDSKQSINALGRGPTIRYFDSRASRKQHNYELLVEPAYRIDLYLANDEAHDRLRRHLQGGTSVYTPALGLSELLATVSYEGEAEGDAIQPVDTTGADSDSVAVDSVLWGGSQYAVSQRGHSFRVERSQAFFAPTTDAGGRLDRTAVGYTEVGYSPDGTLVRASGARFARVNGRTVMFL